MSSELDEQRVLRRTDAPGLTFYCQGCDSCHHINSGGSSGPQWDWNGDLIKPTFTPSVKVTYEHLSRESRMKQSLFKEQHGRYPTHEELPYDVMSICHSFVRDGFIQFLGDCTHRLANCTVPLLPYSQWYPSDAA